MISLVIYFPCSHLLCRVGWSANVLQRRAGRKHAVLLFALSEVKLFDFLSSVYWSNVWNKGKKMCWFYSAEVHFRHSNCEQLRNLPHHIVIDSLAIVTCNVWIAHSVLSVVYLQLCSWALNAFLFCSMFIQSIHVQRMLTPCGAFQIYNPLRTLEPEIYMHKDCCKIIIHLMHIQSLKPLQLCSNLPNIQSLSGL